MKLLASVEPLNGSRDPRRIVLEPLAPAELASQRNLHLVLTGPGQVRGNHFHRLGTEIATVLGPALVRLREEGALRDINVPKGEAYRFVLPPGVSHAFQNTGSELMVLVAFSTTAYNAASPDMERDVLIA
jgi:UDP-2-acetamido-2,6-beta-L-arabino-hexul-4-ose reductase